MEKEQKNQRNINNNQASTSAKYKSCNKIKYYYHIIILIYTAALSFYTI